MSLRENLIKSVKNEYEKIFEICSRLDLFLYLLYQEIENNYLYNHLLYKTFDILKNIIRSNRRQIKYLQKIFNEKFYILYL